MSRLIEILSRGGYVSGEAISRELGISRAAVWKRVEALRSEGWQIVSGGKRGYRLEAGDSLDPALWASRLDTEIIGRGENRYLAEVDSTNTELRRMALSGAPSGSLCLAECQRAGRGRLGRVWNSPAGQGIWLSVLLRPNLPPAQAPLLTFCAALAMTDALRAAAGLDAVLKWPNDVILDGKKVCGILLEISAETERIDSVVIGTGLDVYPDAYPPELKGQAVSLAERCDPPPRREILTAYLTALEKRVGALEKEGFKGIEADYRAACRTLGSRVRVSGAVELTGTARDIDGTGCLIVETEDGERHRVLSGDVSVRGLMGYV